jgi:hypothetical protein
MKSRTWFDTAPGMILAMAALCALLSFSTGCLQHRISVGNGYRIDDKSGTPMLVPIAMQTASSEPIQTVMITLPAKSSEANKSVPDDCAIHGSVFSLRPGSGSDKRDWFVQSPSISGWNMLGAEMDVDAQWKFFIRDLARMHDRGCFPPGLSTQSVRSAISERIPLPAGEVPIFMYSDQGERFVDLAPGMEIRIQKVLSTEASLNSDLGTSLRLLTVVYDVASHHNDRVRLRLSRRSNGGQKSPLATQDRQLLNLGRRFSEASVLRLHLQGLSLGESETHGILIGASGPTQLNALTDLIRKRDPVACTRSPGAMCLDLPSGSVSLFSIISINGHRTTRPFGTSLASLLFRLAPPKQAQALESVRISRRMSRDRYAGIQFTRTVDGAAQLLLLPGDKIEWKD